MEELHKNVSDNNVKQGCTFKTSQEIADELSHVYEEEDSSYNQAFQVMFEGDQSDNKVIDIERVQSNCELDEQETDKNSTMEGDMDTR